MKFAKGGFQNARSFRNGEKRNFDHRREKKIKAKVRKLRSLLDEDDKEQRETFAYLKKALDEDRPSNRRLFN